MAKVRIKDLKAGMVLASHARDSNGRLLLPAGEEVSDKHIHTLMAWGISEVDVEVDIESKKEEVSKDRTSAQNAETLPTQMKEEVDELFRYSNRENSVIKELVELCIMRKMKTRQETP